MAARHKLQTTKVGVVNGVDVQVTAPSNMEVAIAASGPNGPTDISINIIEAPISDHEKDIIDDSAFITRTMMVKLKELCSPSGHWRTLQYKETDKGVNMILTDAEGKVLEVRAVPNVQAVADKIALAVDLVVFVADPMVKSRVDQIIALTNEVSAMLQARQNAKMHKRGEYQDGKAITPLC